MSDASGGTGGGASGGTGERRAPSARATAGARSARRRARELALQGLYQWLVSNEDGRLILAHLSESPGYEKSDKTHFEALLLGAIGQADTLHAAIEPHLDRRVDELSPVEHALLLVASYELANHAEIPYRVVINEAVEIAKTFGGTDGYKYVNGVLDRVAGRLRPVEAAGRRGG